MAGGEPAALVICGPSGVGKHVLIKKLLAVYPHKFGFPVSHTTRGPRHGEVDTSAYHFTDRVNMQADIDAGQFVVYADVRGVMYGISRAAVEHVRNAGKVCILDIDVQGARCVHDQGILSGAKFVFVEPPSLDALEYMLRAREVGKEALQTWRAESIAEMALSRHVDIFDHKLVFDGIHSTIAPQEELALFALMEQWYSSLGEVTLQTAHLGGAGLLGSQVASEGSGVPHLPPAQADARAPAHSEHDPTLNEAMG